MDYSEMHPYDVRKLIRDGKITIPTAEIGRAHV